MKKIAFICNNRLLSQSILASLRERKELGLELVCVSRYEQAVQDVELLGADAAVINAADGELAERAVEMCRAIRGPGRKCLLLVNEKSPAAAIAVEARRQGLADDFVFYDSSTDYLFAKLAAL